jgi:hypothetical protein
MVQSEAEDGAGAGVVFWRVRRSRDGGRSLAILALLAPRVVTEQACDRQILVESRPVNP